MDERFVTANGLRFHCVISGPEHGPLVVLLHGFPESWYSWRHQLLALGTAGFRALAPDLRGYNLSEKPPGVMSYVIARLVADVRGLIAAFGREQAAVVGHDWGGGIAWAAAMWAPEIVARLAVINAPHPAAFLRALRTPGQLARSWYMFFFQLPWLPEWSLRRRDFAAVERQLRRATRPGVFTADDIRRYKEALAQPGALTAAVNYYRAAFRSLRRRPGRELQAIHTPTLLIWAEDDPYLVRELTCGLRPWVPDLRVAYLPDTGHWVQQERPEMVNRLLLDFLQPLRSG